MRAVNREPSLHLRTASGEHPGSVEENCHAILAGASLRDGRAAVRRHRRAGVFVDDDVGLPAGRVSSPWDDRQRPAAPRRDRPRHPVARCERALRSDRTSVQPASERLRRRAELHPLWNDSHGHGQLGPLRPAGPLADLARHERSGPEPGECELGRCVIRRHLRDRHRHQDRPAPVPGHREQRSRRDRDVAQCRGRHLPGRRQPEFTDRAERHTDLPDPRTGHCAARRHRDGRAGQCRLAAPAPGDRRSPRRAARTAAH